MAGTREDYKHPGTKRPDQSTAETTAIAINSHPTVTESELSEVYGGSQNSEGLKYLGPREYVFTYKDPFAIPSDGCDYEGESIGDKPFIFRDFRGAPRGGVVGALRNCCFEHTVSTSNNTLKQCITNVRNTSGY